MDKARKWKLKRNRQKRLRNKPLRQKEKKHVERETFYPDSPENELQPLRTNHSATRCTSLSWGTLLLPPVQRNRRIQ